MAFLPTLITRLRHGPLLLALAAGLCARGGASESAEGLEFFEAKIRPLLLERCEECHGAQKQKGGLRLDSAAGWQAGGDGGTVLVPGHPETSLLIKAVHYGDKDLQMPPKRQLSPDEIAALEQWVQLGAPDPRIGKAAPALDLAQGRRHWAFQPLAQVVPPLLKDDSWSRSEVDRFLLARLRPSGLAPSPPADRRTLLRRATFDLTGLPPTTEEVAAFLADDSPQAFATVVERLLASPQYGEHWARHWLDLARYSDTKGYVYAREERRYVGAWPYRDWVARALTDDLSYDRFLQLQIAADQLVPAGAPDLAAMGFLTLGRRFLGVTHDIIDDRIDVLMRTTEALTVACARCHDHKFDPIPTRDYYALYGVFQSCAERLAPCGAAVAGSAFETELRTREKKLQEGMSTERAAQSARVRARLAQHLLAQSELEKYPEETFGQLLAPEDLNPTFVRRWQGYLRKAGQRNDRLFRAWREYSQLPPAEFANAAEAVTQRLRVLPAEALHPLVVHAFLAAPASLREVAERYGALFADIEKQWRALLKSDPTAAALPEPLAEELRAVLYGPESPCFVPDEPIANNESFFPINPTQALWKLQGEVDRWLLSSAQAPPYAGILVDRAQPATPRVFKRGNPLTKGEEVPRQFLSALAGAPFQKGSGRLELAQAITDPHNPLTARVLVNRVWAQHFGCGLVPTTSDFGRRAEAPSHPELLDWLAQRFMEDGWSLKKLHRRLLLTAAYQQGSAAPEFAQAQELDPQNRLLWHMPPRRLSFEEMRDAWLAATGELDLRAGGPPAEVLAGNNVRRTLYSTVDRERLDTTLRTFDFANPDLSISQRTETTVPQQALFGLNHPYLAARAQAVVRRLEKAGPAEDAARVGQLYAALFQRTPSAEERSAALAFVQSATEPPKAMPAGAWQYGFGEWDDDAETLKNFTRLPYFNGHAWQGGEKWPDAQLGWLQLTATGGHPGNNRQHAVVRRWVAPLDGSYAIASKLIHEPAVGDGIRAFVSHSKGGLLAAKVLHDATAELNVPAVTMRAGETLDFIVDIRDGLNSDQFLWAPHITAISNGGSGGETVAAAWDAEKDFVRSPVTTLRPLEQLAQMLFLTNEFVFLD